MRIGIDASNLRRGGGLTHLRSLLNAANVGKHGIERVVVWGGTGTLEAIEDRPWLIKRTDPVLEQNAIRRAYWQRRALTTSLVAEGCNLLFSPGGTVLTNFRPVVTMSQNLLPFEWRELRRYGFSLKTMRLLTLRWSQSRSFRRSDGVIFLTEYAKAAVLGATGSLRGNVAIIPHGVDDRFRAVPKETDGKGCDRPLTFVYVSPFEPYKHHEKVVQATRDIRRQGLNIKLCLVGPPGASFGRFKAYRRKIDPEGTFVDVVEGVPFSKMPSVYRNADVFLFASSCENMPNIVLEAMASGLPIICSRMGPMPEVLGDAGLYFDPECPESIRTAMWKIATSPALRAEKAHAAYRQAKDFTWARCADDTFGFLAQVAQGQTR